MSEKLSFAKTTAAAPDVRVWEEPDGAIQVRLLTEQRGTSHGTSHGSVHSDAYRYAATTAASDRVTLGYTLRLVDGILTCQEISGSRFDNLVSVDTTFFDPKVTYQNIFGTNIVKSTSPFAICQLEEGYDKIVEILKTKVKVPKPFDWTVHNRKVPKPFDWTVHNRVVGTSSRPMSSAIAWLAYPVVREVGSLALAMNLDYYDERFLSAEQNGYLIGLNFKQAMEKAFGKMSAYGLKKCWEVLTVGHDYKARRTDVYLAGQARGIRITNDIVLEERIVADGLYLEQTLVGYRHLNKYLFDYGTKIQKALGWDYFYQFLEGCKQLGYANTSWDREMPAASEKHWVAGICEDIGFHPKTALNLILEAMVSNERFGLEDTYWMLADYATPESIPDSLRGAFPNGLKPPKKWKDIKELHDKVSRDHLRIKTEASKKPISYDGLAEKLDGFKQGKFEFKLPRSTSDLVEWGTKLDICIASYGDRAVDKNTLLGAVLEDGEVKHCVEFHTKRVLIPPPALAGRIDDDSLPVEYCQTHIIILPRVDVFVPGDETVTFAGSYVQVRGVKNAKSPDEVREFLDAMISEWYDRHKEELPMGFAEENRRAPYSYSTQRLAEQIERAGRMV